MAEDDGSIGLVMLENFLQRVTLTPAPACSPRRRGRGGVMMHGTAYVGLGPGP